MNIFSARTDYHQKPYIDASLDAIGLIVISMAVFDIAKYPYDDEVVRERELRSPLEARQTLTKFLAIITIAVTVESLAFILQTGTTNIRELVIFHRSVDDPDNSRHWPGLVSTPQCAD